MYRTVCTEFWSDPKVTQLNPQSKLLFLYLFTNPHTHLCGLYYLPKSVMIEETGLIGKGIDTLLHTLSVPNLVHFDEDTRTVFVVNMFAKQGKGPKNCQSAASHITTLHKSSLILRFLERYPFMSGYPIDTHSIPPPSTPVPVPDPSLSLNQGKESEKGEDEFVSFWKVYPRKVNKEAAKKAWKNINGTRPALVEMIQAVEKAKESEQWTKENGRFIPYASTWLHGKRWEDEMPKPAASWQEAFLEKESTDDPQRV